MNKREKIERARDSQVETLLLLEMPQNSREFTMQGIKAQNPAAAVDEYHYLRITIDDLDTGKTIIGPIFTYRKPTDFGAMTDELVRIAMWPEELLAGVVWAEFVFAGGDRFRGPITGLKLQKKQTLGGRPKGPGKSKYDPDELLRQVAKSGLSEREFERETGISRSAIQSAKKRKRKLESKKG